MTRGDLKRSFKKSVQLVLTEPPPIIVKGISPIDEDALEVKQVPAVVQSTYVMLRPGRHVVLFCSMENFFMWRNAFSEFATDDNHGFIVDVSPYMFVPSAGSAPNENRRTGRTLLDINTYAVHAFKAFRGTETAAAKMCGANTNKLG